jgi:hypothetical protein
VLTSGNLRRQLNVETSERIVEITRLEKLSSEAGESKLPRNQSAPSRRMQTILGKIEMRDRLLSRRPSQCGPKRQHIGPGDLIPNSLYREASSRNLPFFVLLFAH